MGGGWWTPATGREAQYCYYLIFYCCHQRDVHLHMEMDSLHATQDLEVKVGRGFKKTKHQPLE